VKWRKKDRELSKHALSLVLA
jgi:hypothetical protein